MPKLHMSRARIAAAAIPMATADVTLENLFDHLLYIRQQLLKIDPDSLDATDHEQWRTQVNSTSLAISKVRNAMLAELNAEFAGELPAIETASGQLADA